MNLAVAEEPRVVHALPGRVRVHPPGWQGSGRRGIEARLRRMQGVSEVRANQLTRNGLVRFDPEATDQESVLAAVHSLELDEVEGNAES